MSRNHEIEVNISTRTKQDISPGSTISQTSQFVITNPEVTDEQITDLIAFIVVALQPAPEPEPVPEPAPIEEPVIP